MSKQNETELKSHDLEDNTAPNIVEKMEDLKTMKHDESQSMNSDQTQRKYSVDETSKTEFYKKNDNQKPEENFNVINITGNNPTKIEDRESFTQKRIR